MKKTRTRFAPSPTGYMHIGNLRTALFEYLITKHDGGDFILRIEDTDQQRQVEGATEIIYDTLREVGLHWDEGPDIGGEYGPYIQSEGLPMYKQYALDLIDKGGAHYCFCSQEQIEQQKAAGGFGYVDPCKKLSLQEVKERLENGDEYVIRQTIDPEGVTSFDDEVYGHIEVDKEELDEQILLKSDGFPTYNFANIIDDHQMNISHVVRGNEYLSSTPKYNLIYDAYGWQRPIYVHVPPVMKDEHHKLSKRNGDASFQDLKEKGYLPQAILNYIALLGWAPQSEQEIYTLDELIEAFDIKRISKAPAIFDIDKLTWMNGMYIREMDPDAFYQRISGILDECLKKEYDKKRIAQLVQTRIEIINKENIVSLIDFLDTMDENYDLDMYRHKRQKSSKESALPVLKEVYRQLSNFDRWEEDALHELLLAIPAQMELKNGVVLWPVRTALSGKASTPGGAIELAYLLGKEESLRRIQLGIDRLEKDLQQG
ncbi:MAG: glutamate--tRNA ligase [Erysipelotrichaceae bacterium]|nr:glutamate--tRNA ligase [Erysipelotrichaceae bacterium]